MTIPTFSTLKVQWVCLDDWTNLCHDNVLTLLDELVLSFNNRLQKFEILDMSTVGLSAVDKVLNDTFVDLAAQLEIIHEDVLHGDSL